MTQSDRIPPLNTDDMENSIKRGAEVIGFYADNTDTQVFLKLICRNRDTATVWMHPIVADYMMRYLEKILLGNETSPGAGSRSRTVACLTAAYGEFHPSDPEDED